jgi:hypothetical protein
MSKNFLELKKNNNKKNLKINTKKNPIKIPCHQKIKDCKIQKPKNQTKNNYLNNHNLNMKI